MARKTDNPDVMILREFGDPEGEFYAVMWSRDVRVQKKTEDGESYVESKTTFAHAYKYDGERRQITHHDTDSGSARRAYYDAVSLYLDVVNMARENEAETAKA